MECRRLTVLPLGTSPDSENAQAIVKAVLQVQADLVCDSDPDKLRTIELAFPSKWRRRAASLTGPQKPARRFQFISSLA